MIGSLLFYSQFGYFQISSPGASDNIVTTLESITEIESECTSLFPTGLPLSPNVTAVTQYGGWTQNPTRVMFTNGEREWPRLVYGERSILITFCSRPVANALCGVRGARCAQP
jgi:hypothetical protein